MRMMLLAGLLMAAALSRASIVQAESGQTGVSEAAVDDMCRMQACQHDLHVSLRNRDGSVYEQSFPVFPAVVQPYGIVVVAGQTVHVEAEVSQGALVNLVAVDSVAHPDRTITASLVQDGQGGMLLKVESPFKGSLKFSMEIMPLDRPHLFSTSSCPIAGGTANFESWPYPIFQVVLGAGRVTEGNASAACTN